MYSVDKVEIILAVPSIEETAGWHERVLGWSGYYEVFDAGGHCGSGSVVSGDLGGLTSFFQGTRGSRREPGP